jgi:hypothetical protein
MLTNSRQTVPPEFTARVEALFARLPRYVIPDDAIPVARFHVEGARDGDEAILCEASQVLGGPLRWLEDKVRSGELPSSALGRYTRFRSDVLASMTSTVYPRIGVQLARETRPPSVAPGNLRVPPSDNMQGFDLA